MSSEEQQSQIDMNRNSTFYSRIAVAFEAGGRWSGTCVKLVKLLAKIKAEEAPEHQ